MLRIVKVTFSVARSEFESLHFLRPDAGYGNPSVRAAAARDY